MPSEMQSVATRTACGAASNAANRALRSAWVSSPWIVKTSTPASRALLLFFLDSFARFAAR